MKIAVYADLNLNLIDGSAIWLTSITEILASIDGVQVFLYLKARIESATNIEPLFGMPGVVIVSPVLKPKQRTLSPAEAVARMCLDHLHEKFDAFLFRGLDVSFEASTRPELAQKLWVYFLGLPRDAGDITPDLRAKIEAIVEASQYLLLQTPQLAEQLRGLFPAATAKIRRLPPMVPTPRRRIVARNDERFRVAYAGQFKPAYGSLEMLEIFRRVHAEHPSVEFHVFGEKIHAPADAPGFRNQVRKELESCPTLIWHKGINRDDVLAAYAEMDLGWAWRTDPLEQETLEISTKVLEFGAYGVPPVLARSVINEAVFGTDYPFYANSPAEATEKLLLALRKPDLVAETSRRVREVARPYQFEYIKTEYLEPLCREGESQHRPKRKLLGIAGHTLRFIEPLANRFSAQYDVTKQDRCSHRTHDVKASEELAEEADIIFCEWFLGSAVWHSTNKRDGKKLLVRFHRQELETRYPAEANMGQIDTIIVVSEHTKRDAVMKFGWQDQEQKIVVIQNAIECAYFDRPKAKECQFNIGFVGMAPRLKRLDLALDLIEKCRAADPRFRLFIKGKLPTEYSWLRGRSDEVTYFNEQLSRIRDNKLLADGVVFDSWSDDMGEWYRKVGFILSVSDLEGTHQAVAEGGAAGAVPLIRNWDGADEVYDPAWVYPDIDAMAEKILFYRNSRDTLAHESERCIDYMRRHFDVAVVAARYDEVLGSSRN